MIFRQLFDRTSGTYSYLLASRRGGEALIIDPVLENVDRYLKLLEELDLKLVKAVDTHLHADHITGLGALRDHTRCITVMGAESQADVVSIRVSDQDQITIEGISLNVLHTPGHTEDSYSFALPDRIFTGDTLLIRGTGRTDLADGDARVQYDSIFNRLLKLPDETLVYPAHDYKGDTVSTIGEEKAFNPRLQVANVDAYVALMASLDLPSPKLMDVAIPANKRIGLSQAGPCSIEAEDLAILLDDQQSALVDLRDESEREKYGAIPGSYHVPYTDLNRPSKPDGLLGLLAGHRQVIFYCQYGERSAMAVEKARSLQLRNVRHLKGGYDAWSIIRLRDVA